jgi:phenylacetate-coenzyme A ligase PaaK-like adenylate-forming protein
MCRPLTWLRSQDVFAYLRRMNATHADIQLSRLQALLLKARRLSPAYARGLAGLSKKITTLDALRGAPTLSNEELRDEHAELQSARRGLLCVIKTNGGSPGVQVSQMKTRSAMARELAATWRAFGWAGVGIGDRQERFWDVALDPKSRSKANRTRYMLAERIRTPLGGSMRIEVTRTGHIEHERSGKIALGSDSHCRPDVASKSVVSLQRCAE